MSYAKKTRTARKVRRCDGCRRPAKIRPGDKYIVHTEFPGGDAGYADAAGHPVQMSECAECATRYGRGEMVQ